MWINGFDTFVSNICSSHFFFLVFGHVWWRSYKNTKMLHNLCLHFSKQDGQDGQNRKDDHATKVTKIPKTKRWNERNINHWPLSLHFSCIIFCLQLVWVVYKQNHKTLKSQTTITHYVKSTLVLIFLLHFFRWPNLCSKLKSNRRWVYLSC